MLVAGSVNKVILSMDCPALQDGQLLLSAVNRFPQTEQISPASQNGHRFQCSFTALRHTGQTREINGYSHAGQSFQPLSTGSPHFGQKFFFSGKFIKIDLKIRCRRCIRLDFAINIPSA